MGELITPTLKLVKERFAICNKAYFDGKLRCPQIVKITKSKGYVAQLCFYPNKKTKRCEGFKLMFSEMYEYDDEAFTNIMVHEMIHLYLAKKWIREKDPHGPQWQKMASEMNEKYGLKIKELHEVPTKFKVSKIETLFWAGYYIMKNLFSK